MQTKISRIAVGKNLTIVSTTVNPGNSTQKAKPKPTNRILIFDRSGSMGWVLGRLIANIKEWLRSVPKGDTVTIGWFSSEGGKFRYVVKGARVDSTADLTNLDKVLDGCSLTIGMTCFSEVMADLPGVIEDLQAISDVFALTFFTDGCPVVSDHRKELCAIEENLRRVQSALANSLYVGYGDYYNRDLMANMAQWSGGALVHADDVKKFGEEMKEFTKQTASGTPMISVPVSDDVDGKRLAVFTITGKNPVLLNVENGEVRVASAETTIYELIQDVGGKHSKTIGETELKGLYAAAVILSRLNKLDQSLDVIGLLGDKALANRIANAFTVAEIGATEELLSEAIADPKNRYVEGKIPGCVPKRDAFCVLDALNILIDDDEAKFFPGNPLFQYKRIGVATTEADGYAKFERDKGAACPMNTLVMNKTRPNLSVQTKIQGWVELTDDCGAYGLGKRWSTFQYKNYAIVKDGVLNVGTMPVSVSKNTFVELCKHGVIAATETWEEGKIYAATLSNLPVMNRAMADGHRSARKVAEQLHRTYELEASLKALRHYMGIIDPQGKGKHEETILSEAAVTYLKDLGISSNGYQPKREVAESEDQYMALDFEITAKGFSSYPKIDEVIHKRKDCKKQTPSGQMVLAGIEQYEIMESKFKGKELVNELKSLIDAQTQELRSIRREVQAAKFAVLLGKQWFDEFPSRDDCKMEVNGLEFRFNVKEVLERV